MTVRGEYQKAADLAGTDVDGIILWMDAASRVVDQRLANSGLSSTVLARIEEHLAAHFYEMKGGQTKTSERLPDYAVSYASGNDLADLRSSRNGQIAAMLDTTGSLGEASKPRPAFAVL